MRCLGIVAEYNPFHTGHRYHIERAKAETGTDGVVVIMSGSFVQRGEPAIFDKWTRTGCALEGGADLVLELPAVYALSSAESFARGAVETLCATGVVRTLSFGSECGDLALLEMAAHILRTQPPAFSDALHKALQSGKTYAASRAEALALLDAEAAACLTGPNNILAIAYLCALGREKGLRPHTVKRVGEGYLSEKTKEKFASALAIRAALEKGEDCRAYLPYQTDRLRLHSWATYEKALVYALRIQDPAALSAVPSVLRKRIRNCREQTLPAILEHIKTRNVTMAMVKRTLCRMLTGMTVSDAVSPDYIRVLGFNKRGAAILREMKRTAALPLIVKPAQYRENSAIWEAEKRATDVYFMYDPVQKRDLTESPVHIL